MVIKMIEEIVGVDHITVEVEGLVYFENNGIQIIAKKNATSQAIIIDRQMSQTKVYSDLAIAHHNLVNQA